MKNMHMSVNTYVSLAVIGTVSAMALVAVQARTISDLARPNRREILRSVTPSNSTVEPGIRAIN